MLKRVWTTARPCVAYYLNLLREASTDWKNKIETGTFWLALLSPFIVTAVGALYPKTNTVTDYVARLLGPGVAALVVLRILWINYKKASGAQSALNLTVNVQRVVCAAQVVTMSLQIINRSHTDAVFLRLLLRLADGTKWEATDKYRSVPHEAMVAATVWAGPYQDMGMERSLPMWLELDPQKGRDGWITFAPHPWGEAPTLTETSHALVLEVFDGANQTKEVPLTLFGVNQYRG